VGTRTGFADGRETAVVSASSKSVARDYIETILVCVIFVIFTRAFVFQQSKIPSGSMEDTLLIGDYIMVNRFVYAPMQFPWERALLPVRDLRRGDIVVFKFPATPEVDYIKRLIGLPGDTVELRHGDLYLNGVRQEEPYVEEGYRSRQPFGPVTVAPGHYFMMGDHRNASADSREGWQVSRDLIKGRALLIWWSYQEDRNAVNLRGSDQLKAVLSKIVHLPGRSRWNRCFRVIR
jgi:signal peptidase I